MEQKNLELSPRQKLIYEAFQKIHEGERLQREGLIELNNLIPDSGVPKKTVANKMMRTPGFRKSDRTDPQLIDRVLGLIDKGDRVTSNYVHRKLGISEKHARRLKDKMKAKKQIVEKGSPGGGAIIWTRPKPKTKARTKPENFIGAETNADKMLTYLKTNTWITTRKLVDDTKITWYPAKRTLAYLIAKGLAKIVRKAGNPSHKGTSSFNRAYDYWEAV